LCVKVVLLKFTYQDLKSVFARNFHENEKKNENVFSGSK
jgi:hypothetical protein